MWQKNCYRIVVKVGTSTITHDTGALNLKNIERLVRVLVDLEGFGHEVVFVTSGAIGVGTKTLLLKERPSELRLKQAAAAVGQCRLMHVYDQIFGEYGRTVAQILLTDGDVADPVRKDHLSGTIRKLLEMGIIPIVNENDSVSSAEIETGEGKVLGDNDTLSAIVSELVEADLLILLSDIDGLYDSDPKNNKDAKIIHEVDAITPALLEMAGGKGSWRGTGGMVTKLAAAKIAFNAGFDMVIANGSEPEMIYDIVEGKQVGTRFKGKKND